MLLSYPNTTDPNTVKILDGNNATIFQSTIYEKVLQADENETDSVPPFHAYSPSGDVTVSSSFMFRPSTLTPLPGMLR